MKTQFKNCHPYPNFSGTVPTNDGSNIRILHIEYVLYLHLWDFFNNTTILILCKPNYDQSCA